MWRLDTSQTFQVPLHVSVSLPPAFLKDIGTTLIQKFLDQFRPNTFGRIRSLKAVNTKAAWTIPTINLLQNSLLPELEDLDVGLINSKDSGILLDGFESMENLVRLCTRWLHLVPNTIPPFNRITTLEVHGRMTSSFTDFLKVLSQMTTLEELLLFDIRDYLGPSLSESSSDSDLKTLPTDPLKLSKITLKRVNQEDLDQLFAIINPKYINALFLSTIFPRVNDPTDGDLPSIVNQCVHLRKLRVEDCLDADWIQMFRSLPELADLHIASCMIEDIDLKPLAGPPEDTSCRELTNITIDNELALTTTVIREIVEARVSSSKPVSSIVLRGWDADSVGEEDVIVIRTNIPNFVLGTFDAEAVVKDAEGSFEEESSGDTGQDDSFGSGDKVIIEGRLPFE